MAFCQTCGAANSEQAKFCASCGARLPSRPQPITVFYSYSHKDEDLRGGLEAHLAPLRRSGLIREWHDRKLIAGQDWDKEISSYLESAELILFLISADFLNSSYVFDVEVKRALERQSAGQAAVVPVILRPVVWTIVPELGRLQALPEGARPVTEWPSQDLAFVSVCEGIVAVVLARASAAAGKAGPAPDVVPSRPAMSRGRRRILDAALPARVPLTKPSTLLVLIRRTDSPGLRAIVEAEPEYDITPKDIDSEPLTLKFPLDNNGTPQPLDLSIKIESPQFEPRSQIKSIRVPPRGDSLPRVFFLTPIQAGPLLVNLEICRGDEMIAGCVLHSVGVEAAGEAEELPPAQSVASASLGMSGDDTEQVQLAGEQVRPGEERSRTAEHRRLEEKRRHREATTLHRERTAYSPPPPPSPQTPSLPAEATKAAPPPAPAPQVPRTLHEPAGPVPLKGRRLTHDAAPQAPSTLHESPRTSPASVGPPSGAAQPVPSSMPQKAAAPPPASPRRSFVSRSLYWVTGVAAALSDRSHWRK